MKIYIPALFFIVSIFSPAAAQTADLPREWVDADTGHRIVRLSEEAGSQSFYFHQNGYTASGDKLVFSTPKGLSTYNFKTKTIEQIVEGRTGGVIVGRKSRKVFYWKGDSIFETNVDTKATREVIKDPKLRSGSGLALNADETLLGGSMIAGEVPEEFRSGRPPTTPAATPTPIPGAPVGQVPARDNYPGKGDMMERRLAAKIPMSLYSVNIKSGELKMFHPATDWLNHVQFSPNDPTLMMFCHEGPWHKVDRIWTIRTDGSDLKKIHTRTMDMEIAGHEFFSADGKQILYDLQTPKSQVFWLASYDIKSGKMTKYSLTKREWSVHFGIAPDGKSFLGDGGGPNSVAKGDNGQWIYLFHPKDGKFESEKLVNLAKHDYSLEPNATFTPDGKWIVFRSNMLGPTHLYAVEIAKAKK
ncbi:MAG TPA: oligogalacturonate lyase family protein [Pyrinomonadaceae bacterium]|nr:oligogalacturonate lyase family protein [Pyrinomonadaceae bacterium]